MNTAGKLFLALIHIALFVGVVYYTYTKVKNESIGKQFLWYLLALIVVGLIMIPINLMFML